MPLYDVQCTQPQCKEVQEIFCCIKALKETILTTKCNRCGGSVEQILSVGKVGDWFHPHINEDFDGTPIEVTSRRHLKELCKKHGVQARALL